MCSRKRGNGEGYIGQRKDGSWEARLTVGYKADGKQKFKSLYGKSRKDVSKKLLDYQMAIKKGICVDSKDWKISDWLDYWYKNHVIGKVKLSSRVNDESIINHHLKSNFGRVKLSKLKGFEVQQVYNQMLVDGRADKKGGLSAKSIRNIHIVLNRALEQAVKDDLLIKNPLYSVSLPRQNKKEIEILSVEEQKRLIQICDDGQSFSLAIMLASFSGLRMGELLGLSWDSIDFENSRICIRNQVSRLKDYDKSAKAKTCLFLQDGLKSKCSKRNIEMSGYMMSKLKEHKKAQGELCKRLGDGYNKHNLVFMSASGGIVDPSTFRSFYVRALKKANISHKSFHAIRHTFATRALESGVNIKVLSEILGHSNIQITLDTYCHVLKGEQKKAMDKIVENVLC